jgi:hypothetical protein
VDAQNGSSATSSIFSANIAKAGRSVGVSAHYLKIDVKMHAHLAIIAAVVGVAAGTFVKSVGYADAACTMPISYNYDNSE